MDCVELRGLGARYHPLLAMAPKENVGLDIVRIPQMIDKTDEGVGGVFLSFLLLAEGRALHRCASEQMAYLFAPLFVNAREMAVEEIPCFTPGFQTLRIATVRFAVQSTQGSFNLGQLGSDETELIGGGICSAVGRYS